MGQPRPGDALVTTLRHPSVRVDPSEPCPFCDCGNPLNAHAAKRRQTKHVKTYRPCACTFCEEGRRVRHTTAQIIATFAYLGGICEANRPSAAAELSPEYQAHLDAGERPVADIAAGGYRWEKGNAA
jgi:hypothetical protein